MTIRKGLITKLGETFDQHRSESVVNNTGYTSVSQSVSWWKRLLPLLGNMIFTLIIVATLLVAQNNGLLPLFAAPNAQTASTGTIAYQGRLADAEGNALTDTVNMSFRLYSAAAGGAPLWEEQWTGTTSVQVSDGLFNVMLGSVSPIPQDVITGNSNLFLGITVGTDSEMSPRVQLGSVPFATQALTVPDASITSRKVKLLHGKTATNFATATLELPGSYIELDGTRAEIMLDVPQTVVVIGTFDFLVSDGGTAGGKLNVNGSNSADSAVFRGTRGTVSQTWIVDLDAGTHTLYLAGRRASAGGVAEVGKSFTTMTWFAFAQ